MNPLICDLCGLSVLLLLVQVLMPALPLCIDQLYSDGNMSDHQSKQMHGIKQNADVTVFCPAFSLGTACVLGATFTSFRICQGKENFTWLGFLQPGKIGGKKSWFLWHFHQTSTERRDDHHCVIVSSWLFCHIWDRRSAPSLQLSCCPPCSYFSGMKTRLSNVP